MFPDYRDTFPVTEDVLNIEFGAGKGCFGKTEFPECFLTDIHDYEVSHASDCQTPVIGECHFLDGIEDFFTFDSRGKRFENLIFCNPYGFGFQGKTSSEIFLNNAERLLLNGGQIFVLGQFANHWVNNRKIQKWLDKYNTLVGEERWELISYLTKTEIDYFNSRHIFRYSTGGEFYTNCGYTLRLRSDGNE